jgi:hypothetical protein
VCGRACVPPPPHTHTPEGVTPVRQHHSHSHRVLGRTGDGSQNVKYMAADRDLGPVGNGHVPGDVTPHGAGGARALLEPTPGGAGLAPLASGA